MDQLNKNNNDYNDDILPIKSFTTENIAGYLKYFNLKNKSVLTVDSSGDQVLNSIFYGAKNTSLCNSSMISKYYLYLKIAGLLSLNYNEFTWFFLKHNNYMHRNNRMFSKRLFKKMSMILKVIDNDSYLFFEELFESLNPKDARNKYFIDSNYHNKAIKNFNIYLRNENTYNKLRDSIISTNIDFVDDDITSSNIGNSYDVILLSSICTKLTLNKFINLVKKLEYNNLSNNGEIMLGYLWGDSIYTEEYSDVWKKIYSNPMDNKYLRKYVSECYQVSGYQNYLWEDNKRDDKVLVYRK